MAGPPPGPYAPPAVAPTAPPQVPPYAYYPGYAPQPPPAPDNTKTIIIVIVIAVVAVAAIGIGLFALMSALRPIVIHPFVQFATPTNANGNTTIVVSSVSAPAAPSDLLVRLSVGSSNGTEVPMAASGTAAIETVNGVAYRITWTDVDGSRSLTMNDMFLLSGNGVALPKNQIFAFYVYWSSGGTTLWSGETVWST